MGDLVSAFVAHNARWKFSRRAHSSRHLFHGNKVCKIVGEGGANRGARGMTRERRHVLMVHGCMVVNQLN